MGTWNSRGLRGSFLEEMINLTNEKYRDQKLALIQKVPTPIKPIRIDQATRHITLAYFDQKSTVDYIGVVQGIPVCFDAKECEEQDGIAFLIIYFKSRDLYMYLPCRTLTKFWQRMEQGGLKSFHLDELDPSYEISPYSGTFLHYLEQIKMDMERR